MLSHMPRCRPIIIVLLYRPWEDAVAGFADSVGLPADQIKYVSALLAGIPIGFMFRFVTSDPFSKQVSLRE